MLRELEINTWGEIPGKERGKFQTRPRSENVLVKKLGEKTDWGDQPLAQ